MNNIGIYIMPAQTFDVSLPHASTRGISERTRAEKRIPVFLVKKVLSRQYAEYMFKIPMIKQWKREGRL